jgi:hypothetical protein
MRVGTVGVALPAGAETLAAGGGVMTVAWGVADGAAVGAGRLSQESPITAVTEVTRAMELE